MQIEFDKSGYSPPLTYLAFVYAGNPTEAVVAAQWECARKQFPRRKARDFEPLFIAAGFHSDLNPFMPRAAPKEE
jgi:hypothetical protein